jgi:hypothetical protein
VLITRGQGELCIEADRGPKNVLIKETDSIEMFKSVHLHDFNSINFRPPCNTTHSNNPGLAVSALEAPRRHSSPHVLSLTSKASESSVYACDVFMATSPDVDVLSHLQLNLRNSAFRHKVFLTSTGQEGKAVAVRH